MAKTKGAKSAAKEAYEEAGVIGECENNMLGVIQIEKSPAEIAEVNIYPMKIESILPEWQEAGTRNLQESSSWTGPHDTCLRSAESSYGTHQ